ncbi:MAG: aspartyl/asparaginyl beta-hydroxylase domain-containing protein [Rhodobacteraceae bacterium]|nr:aspartyl/asparaginyl beta-hydroxylase domain-containing protein [Paracoccaceae bacterium]
MNAKSIRRLARVVIPLAILIWLVPWLALFFVVCGILDLARHKRFDPALIAKYFSGNGLLTWLLSPVNLFFDLISKRNHYRMQLSEFPDEERAEIEGMLKVFDTRRDEILADLQGRMDGKRRGMVFYRWYDQPADLSIPEFNRDFKYVKTIGVSIFNGQEKTSLHFGPLRLTIRLLYNLTTRQSDEIFIEANGEKHYWHDDPLYIFDDTIQHRSVNGEDGLRACVFVDVLRPSAFTRFQNGAVKVCNVLLSGVNRVFYKNWDMIGTKPAGSSEPGAS